MNAPPSPSSTPRRAAAFGALAVMAALLASAGRADEPPRRYPRDRPVDIISEKLDLDVDLEGKSVSGTATILFTPLATPLAALELDAVDLEVAAVRELEPEARPLAFRTTGEKLVIAFPAPLVKPEGVAVEVSYRVVKPRAGLYFFGPAPDDPEVPLQVWSQNESEDARYWFPCVDTPEERAESEMVVHAPKGFEVVSNGACLERGVVEKSGKARWRWKTGFAHPAYLVTLVVGKFAVARDTWRGIPITTYVPPSRAADATRSFANTKEMLDYFSERFGVVYPYEQYAQVVVEQFIEGGMENLSATTLTERTLHDARAHLDYTSDPLVSHELAHQWWGDLVTCRDWAHIWLNEGFASYFEACWDEKKNGEDAYDFNMLEKAGGALNGGRTTPLVRRRYLTSGETFGGGTYPKGAWVLHMLRRELGEDAFWRGLRAYILEHHGQAVETEDFRRSMEKATARSLGDFFWQWTERAGHPVLDVTVAWDDKDSLLEVSCVQKQEGEPFSFTVDLAVAEAPPAGGAAPRLVPMRVAKKEERLLVPLAARPLWVAFDARQALLKEITLHEDRDQLLAMLTRAPRPILRAEAARALGRDHAPSVVAALGKALLSEPFWAAEEEIARVLGGVPGEEARDALLEGLAVKDPRPRRAVVQALGSFRGDRKVAGALLALLAAGEPSVHVEADAAVALAKTGDPRAYDVLAAMLEKDSSQETLRCAGLRGLGELPDLRGLALARRRMARRNPREVRETAIEVAGRLAARKECDDATRRAVAAEIATILEESHPRLREEAVGALRGLGAESALPALDALAAHDPDEDLRNRARDAAEKIRSGAPPDAEMARLRADLARLAEENAALKDRVERMEARAGAQESKGGAQAASDGAAGPKKNP